MNTNPIDWGGSPFANAAVRGFIAAIITGILYALYELQSGAMIEEAAVAGAIPALIALLALLGYGGYDQKRAADGKVIASDVPVQIKAKAERRNPTVVAGDWPRGTR
jgi:hypothetical protein